MENLDSPFLFVNPNARNEGGRDSLESVRNIWYKACDDGNIRRIWPYRGLKHTACMEFVAREKEQHLQNIDNIIPFNRKKL